MSVPSRSVAGGADPTAADEPAHRHAWAGLRFELADDHPWVIETCSACGQTRRYRAFERSWDPAAGPSHEPSRR